MGRRGFPQLEVARDPERMRAIFERHLQPPAGPAVAVRACEVAFVRGRASARCLLQYTLHLAEPATGRQWSQLATGVMYSGERTRLIWKRLRRTDPAATVAVGFPPLPPVAYVPELDLLIQVFPYDHRLPALARLMAGPPPELVPPLLAEFGPGDWRLEGWAAEAVRYRVDMRAMVRVAVGAREAATGRAAERRVYAKVYRDEEEGAQAARVLQALGEAAGAAFAVGPAVVYSSELRTLVQAEVPGTRLLDVLRRGDEALPAVRRAARAVAALHRLPLDRLPLRRRPPRDELARLAAVAETLRAAAPELGPAIDEVAGAVAAGLGDAPPAPTHFDLKPGHILLDGDRVALLDFDKLVAADPLVDVANLLANLGKERGQSRGRPGHGQAIALAFVAEYFAHAPAAWRDRLPAHHALALLAEAATTGRGLRGRAEKPGRADRIAASVREAQAALAGSLR